MTFQPALGEFAAECEAVGMRISTSKYENMVLRQNKVEGSLWVGKRLQRQVEEEEWSGRSTDRWVQGLRGGGCCRGS